MNRTKLCAALVGGMVLSGGALASADQFHYNNILIGDRAAGMGGAYTAVSDDPSGMYYTPAGLAYASGRSISASVNAYTVSNRTYKGTMGDKWTRTSSSLLPNFFGIVQPVGKFKVGFSYAVPDSTQEDQDQSFYANSAVINFNNKNDTTLFGPSAALLLKENLSVGATLYIHKRSTESILNATKDNGTITVNINGTPTITPQYQWENSYSEIDEWGLRPMIGVMWAPVDKFSVGASISKTYVLASEILLQKTISNNGSFNRPNNSMTTSSEKVDYPYQVTVGAAYFPTPSLLLSADVSYYSSFSYNLPAYDNSNVLYKKKCSFEAVVNGAVGAEYYLNPAWAVRAGLFTDFANTPKLQIGKSDQYENIDMIGGSVSVSHFTKNTSLTFGGNYKSDIGNGRHQVAIGTDVQPATMSSWSMFVSSSYSY